MGAGEGGGERVGRRKRQMGKKERDGGERKGGRREKDHQPSSKAQDQESDDIIFIKCLGNYTQKTKSLTTHSQTHSAVSEDLLNVR